MTSAKGHNKSLSEQGASSMLETEQRLLGKLQFRQVHTQNGRNGE